MPYHVTKSGSCPSSKPYAVIKDSDGKVMGCHPTRAAANKQMAALYAAEKRRAAGGNTMAEVEVEVPVEVPADETLVAAAFESVLIIEGETTTDRRRVEPGALTWRELPIPLMWQRETEPGHRRSVVVGKITEITRAEGGEIRAVGLFDEGSEDGREAQRLVSEQMQRWVSVDLEVIDDEFTEAEDGEMLQTVTSGRIMGATIVAFPAFPGAVIAPAGALIPDPTPDGRPAATVTEAAELTEPLVVTDKPWDFSTARFTDEEWRHSAAACEGLNENPKSDCYLPHHEPSGAVNRRAVFLAAARFNQAQRRNKEKARSHLAGHYRNDLNLPVPEILQASVLVASADRWRPPKDWFADPELKSLAPVTITHDGRIYGHVAAWGQCHIGFSDACVVPPRSQAGYAYFLTGETSVSDCDCESIPTGPITMGTLHARPPLTPQQAVEHYEHTGVVVADVSVGEDAHGIWVAGAIRPDASESQRAALRGSSLSGDWRRVGGNLELVGLLAVNVPGFPIPRLAVARRFGQQVSLVAAGLPREEPVASVPSGVSASELLAELKALSRAGHGEEPVDESLDAATLPSGTERA